MTIFISSIENSANSVQVRFHVFSLFLFIFFQNQPNFWNFLFASMVNEILRKRDMPLMEKICSTEYNSFLYELTPFEKGDKTENKEVASPESIPVHLNFRKNYNN